MNNAKLIKEIIKDLKKSLHLKDFKDFSLLKDAWEKAVGEKVAKKSKVISLNKGVLYILVESAMLRYELESYMKNYIISKLNELIPDKNIFRIKFMVANPGLVKD
jgi:predicted nucleic acid-binding Zn ribbon protein